jgi:predicted MFS family arabinose efflux permease
LKPPQITTSPIMTAAETPQPAKAGFDLRNTFAALRFPNYRLWFRGQLVSLVGTWMQSTAQGFLVYQLTNSPAYLGYVGFASGIPTWLFTLYGGVVSDRMPRRTLLVITQTSMLILAFILAGLTFAGMVQPWHVLVLAFLLGIANAFDAPARQSFVLEMVDRESLTNAIALNGSMFNSATAVGPAIAGLTYAAFGAGWCFTINGISFIAVIIALLLMKLKPWQPPEARASTIEEMKVGVVYVLKHPVIRVLMIGAGMISVFGFSFITLLPAWAVTILGGDATTNGLLQSARGIGALIAALIIASLGSFNWKGKLLTAGSLIGPVFLLIFALMRGLPLSLLMIMVVGWAFMIFNNVNNALIQTRVQDDLRGRVMGVYMLIFNGLSPIGALLAGTMADRFGEQFSVLVMAAIFLAYASFAFIFFPQIRRSS